MEADKSVSTRSVASPGPVLLLAAVLIVSCGERRPSALAIDQPADAVAAAPATIVPAERVVATAKWPSFDSIRRLSLASDLVIRGRVVAVRPGRVVASYSGAPALPFTNATVRIDEILQGSALVGDTVTVEQTGGMYYNTAAVANQQGPLPTLPPEAGPNVQPRPRLSPGPAWVRLELEDDPLYQVNDEVVVFLSWKSVLGVYRVPAPQGRYRLSAGRVRTMAPADPLVARFEGMPIDAFITSLRAELARP